MLVPTMYDMRHVMAESGYTEEQVFDLGISGSIVFLVVVPEIGACRVPDVALSHFMAGAEEYIAEGMPEHYSGRLSKAWTVKRDRLRVLPESWEKYSRMCLKLVGMYDSAINEEIPNDGQIQQADEGASAQPSRQFVTPSVSNTEGNLREKLTLLFDPVTVETLEKMFPAAGKWKIWAERAARNGLSGARSGRRLFNPYLAAFWFLKQGIEGWDTARINRTLANNLPDRSRHDGHLLTGDMR